MPEGIIFQSGTAYKALRKMLVEGSLVAVVSLPAGVFNPYSGVKTSILFLDKRVHKQTDSVLFVKVQNDGFNLGAQRRAVVGSDLPEAARLLRSWITAPQAFEGDGVIAQAVARERIGEDGGFNLSGERYGGAVVSNSAYPQVLLGNTDVFKIESGGTPSSTEDSYWNGGIAWATLADLPAADRITKLTATTRTISQQGLNNSSAKVLPVDTVLVSSRATIGRVALAKVPMATNQGFKNIIIQDIKRASPDFVAHMMKRLAPEMERMASGGTFKEISKAAISTLSIPLPPLEVQQQIVAEIEGYQKVIDGARQVLDGYKPLVALQNDWPVVPLSEVCNVNPKKSQLSIADESTPVAFVPMADISEREMLFAPKEQRPISEVFKQYTYFENEDVLLAKVTPCFENGKSGIARQLTGGVGFGSSEFFVLRADPDKVLPEWIYFQVTSDRFRRLGAAQMTGTGGLQRVPRDFVAHWKIPVPDLPTQRAIVAEIEAEQALVNANRELIRRMEAKVKATIDRVWGSGE